MTDPFSVVRELHSEPFFPIEAMRTLSAPARTALENSFIHSSVTPYLRRSADAGETVKYLFKLRDGRTIETVVMHYPATSNSRSRTTICVSSQVGCPIGWCRSSAGAGAAAWSGCAGS